MKRWTQEEEQILLEGRRLGKTYKQIVSDLPGRSEKSLSLKYRTLEGADLRNYWTDAEDVKLTELYEQGLTAKQISIELSRPLEGLKTRISSKIKTGDLAPRQYYWDEAELLSAVKKFPTFNSLELASSKDSSVPSRSAVVRKFGSWNNALEKAGLPRNISGLRPDKPTIIYLVYFLDENFYKIGITQNSVAKRLSGYPEYIVLDVITELTLQKAIDLEKELLQYTDKHKYTPVVFGDSGHTECFKTKQILERLEDIRELLG